jgi:choline dehydrogenase
MQTHQVHHVMDSLYSIAPLMKICSESLTFDAFLPRKLALDREKNLTICTSVIASRIEFSDKEAELHAEKVLFQYSSGNSEKVFCAKMKREVIVCSGAVGSPQV